MRGVVCAAPLVRGRRARRSHGRRVFISTDCSPTRGIEKAFSHSKVVDRTARRLGPVGRHVDRYVRIQQAKAWSCFLKLATVYRDLLSKLRENTTDIFHACLTECLTRRIPHLCRERLRFAYRHGTPLSQPGSFPKLAARIFSSGLRCLSCLVRENPI